MTLSIMLVSQPWGPDCPVCGKSIMATYAFRGETEVSPTEDPMTAKLSLSGELLGISVEHDCIPPTARDEAVFRHTQFVRDSPQSPQTVDPDQGWDDMDPVDQAREIFQAMVGGELDPAVVILPDLLMTEIRAVRDGLLQVIERAIASAVPFTPTEG